MNNSISVGLTWPELIQVLTIIFGFAGLIFTNWFTSHRQRDEAKAVAASAADHRQRLKEQADEMRRAAADTAEAVRLAVAESERRLFEYHVLILGKIDDNTALTKKMGDETVSAVRVVGKQADAAFKEANDVNMKLENIGVKLINGETLTKKK